MYGPESPLTIVDPTGLYELVQGPHALIVSWVEKFTPLQLSLDTALTVFFYEQRFGEASAVDIARIAAFLLALAASYNPTPPIVFADVGAFYAWEGKKEHRGWALFRPFLECCSGTVTYDGYMWKQHPGYTPIDFYFFRTYQIAQLGPTMVTKTGYTALDGTGGTCRTYRARSTSALSTFADFLQQLGVTGHPAPLISREIEYRICCDGQVTVKYSGSHFPSHRAFLENMTNGAILRIDDQPQSGLPLFIFSSGIVPPTEFARAFTHAKIILME